MDHEHGLYWANIPLERKNKTSYVGFLERKIQRSFLADVEYPYFIFTSTGRIERLEKFKLTEKQANKLRKSGLYIYLYEPLSLYKDSYNRAFYSEFRNTDTEIRATELDSIDMLAEKYNIPITVYTCDYNVQQLYYPRLVLKCLDFFIRQEYISPNKDWNIPITKKFWCGNWRYTAHRHIVMSYLAEMNGNFSWHIKSTYKDLKDNVWFDCPEVVENGAKILENKTFKIEFDVCVEVKDPKGVYIPNDNAPGVSVALIQSYQECFCAVINETRFAQPTGNFSEKTLIPLSLGMPFVLVAPPYTLEYLHRLGFKTFSAWWDESYDQEENHTKRMLKIFQVIDRINSKSIEELQAIKNDMQEVLDHNKNVMKSIRQNSQAL